MFLHMRNLCIVFQRYSVFPHPTVRDTVLFGPELPRAPLAGRFFGRTRRAARLEAEQMRDMHALPLELWKQTGPNVFMVTHDIAEGFTLGTRLLVFDKLRRDPQHADAYGASITYALPLNQDRRRALPPELLHWLQNPKEACA